MHMRISRHPSLAAQVLPAFNLKLKFLLSRPDSDFLSDWRVLVAFADFHKHVTHRHVCGELPSNIREISTSHHYIRPVVLKPVRIDLCVVTIRSEVFTARARNRVQKNAICRSKLSIAMLVGEELTLQPFRLLRDIAAAPLGTAPTTMPLLAHSVLSW